ncbi:MAG: hypothetical protein PVI11_03630, partial [Candidatus Aminicenantes bacterium]
NFSEALYPSGKESVENPIVNVRGERNMSPSFLPEAKMERWSNAISLRKKKNLSVSGLIITRMFRSYWKKYPLFIGIG